MNFIQISDELSSTIKEGFDKVVELINKGGTKLFDADEVAGQFAYLMVEPFIDDWDPDGREGLFDMAIRYPLDDLEKGGAIFSRFFAETEATAMFSVYMSRIYGENN